MNKEIELINSIIEEAIDHGGDSGGPYYCNFEGLATAIRNWLSFKNLDKDYYLLDCPERPPLSMLWGDSEDDKAKAIEAYDLINIARKCHIYKKEN